MPSVLVPGNTQNTPQAHSALLGQELHVQLLCLHSTLRTLPSKVS